MKYEYKGDNPYFKPGDKLKVSRGYEFRIKKLIEIGVVNYDDTYTFKKYSGFAYGDNWFYVEEGDFRLPEFGCDKIQHTQAGKSYKADSQKSGN